MSGFHDCEVCQHGGASGATRGSRDAPSAEVRASRVLHPGVIESKRLKSRTDTVAEHLFSP